MDWRERFLAPFVIDAHVARHNPDRGVVITDVDGRYQAYAWDRRDDSIRAVTDTKAALLTSAISHDGRWIYALVEEETGTEVGHIHRFAFDGSYSEDITPGLSQYAAFSLVSTPTGLAATAGIEGKQAVIVVDGESVRVLEMPSLVTGLAVSRDGREAAISMSTPGKGMVPMMRVVDLMSGEPVDEAHDMMGGAIHNGRVAVAMVDGDWMRPGIWTEGSVTPIGTDIPGSLNPVDWAEDGSTILLKQSYRSTSAFYLHHAEEGTVTPLPSPPGATHPWAPGSLIAPDRALSIWSDANNPYRVFEATPDGYELALDLEAQRTFPGPPFEEFAFSSTEGAEIQGWLLRPSGKGPWPTVLHTHGGPTSVAGPTFNPIASAWFDSGFAVASINYRGSTTFGESFRETLTGNLGGPDVADVVAARRWLIESGVADPDRIVKNGYSYGGYLTLQSLGTHPELWAAGVAGAPIADWRMNYEDSNDILRGYFVSIWGGTPDEKGEEMEKASPRSYVSDYAAPLLISQPESDSRTPLRPVQRFVDELEHAGKEVHLDLLSGGHAGSGKDQTIQMVETWLEFGRDAVGLSEEGDGSPDGEDDADD